MGPLGPLPWKVMGHIMKSWDNDPGATTNLKACFISLKLGSIEMDRGISELG